MTVFLDDKKPYAAPSGRVVSLLLQGEELAGVSSTMGVSVQEVARLVNEPLRDGIQNPDKIDILNRSIVDLCNYLLEDRKLVDPQIAMQGTGRRATWKKPDMPIDVFYEVRASQRKVEYEEADVLEARTAEFSSLMYDFPDPLLARYWIRPWLHFGWLEAVLFDFAPANPPPDTAIFGEAPDRPIRKLISIPNESVFGQAPDRAIRKLGEIEAESVFGQAPDRAIRKLGELDGEAIFGKAPDRRLRKVGELSDVAIFGTNTRTDGTARVPRPIRKIGEIPDIAIFGKPPDRPIQLR